jgi:hypothetical protein
MVTDADPPAVIVEPLPTFIPMQPHPDASGWLVPVIETFPPPELTVAVPEIYNPWLVFPVDEPDVPLSVTDPFEPEVISPVFNSIP